VGREKRGGYVFDWWIGDHTPKHVHVYKDGHLLAKIQVPDILVLNGHASKRVLKLLQELIDEGKL